MSPAALAECKRELEELLPPGASLDVAVIEGVVIDPAAPNSIEFKAAWMAGPISVKAATMKGAVTLMRQAVAEAR